MRGNGQGDQYVEVEIVIPTNLSREEKQTYEKLREMEGKQKKSVFQKFKDSFR